MQEVLSVHYREESVCTGAYLNSKCLEHKYTDCQTKKKDASSTVSLI